MKYKKRIIIFLLFIILSIFISYYIFKIDSKIINKTADNNNFYVIFERVSSVEKEDCEKVNVKISENKKNVFIDVPKLLKKGAYAKITLTIKNIGSLPAKLVSIEEYGLNTSGPISVTYDGIGITDEPFFPGSERKIVVKIMWDKDLESDFENVNIKIKLNYVQG